MIYNHEIRLNHKLNTQISLELFVPSAFTSFLKNKKLDLFHYPKFKSGLLHHLATRFKEKTLSIRSSDNEKTFEEYFSGFFIPCIYGEMVASYQPCFFKNFTESALRLRIKCFFFHY